MIETKITREHGRESFYIDRKPGRECSGEVAGAAQFEQHGLTLGGIEAVIVREGPDRINDLVNFGLEFTRNKQGGPDLGREGGHSHRRILHVKDMTGKAIEEALLAAIAESPSIELLEHVFAIDLITARKLGQADSAGRAYARAYAADPTSAFGGVIAFNRQLDDAMSQPLFRWERQLHATAYAGEVPGR